MIALLLAVPALAVTREDALDNAAAYAMHVWTATSANRTAECSSDYESDYDPGTYTGLPYDWGGYVTLDEFDAGIAAGDGAGSHSWHGILECTVGVDCSGFLSKVWEVGHYSTSTFYETTHDIDWDEIQRADAVNDAGSHVVMYTHLSEGGWPVFYEASGGADKVHLNSDGGWSYLSGYQPIRLDGIADGGSTGTPSAPIEIGAFPYADTRWTAGAATDAIDSYGCAPDTDESGPEVYYHFHAATGGRLQVVVSDTSEVDVDIHVLTAPRGDACLGRDDTEVDVSVPAGDVWVVIDSYVGSREFPGPFVLTADFVPDGEAEEDPEDTAPVDDTGTPDDGTGNEGRDEGGTAPRAQVRQNGEKPGGCGCVTSPAGPGAAWVGVGVAALVLTRRRADARRG